MKLIKTALFSLVLSVAGLTLAPVSTFALDPLSGVCANDPTNEVCVSQGDDANELIKTIVSTLLFIVGALSVVMIIVSGVYYVTSTGDAGKVARAKNTLTYSIVGLVVSILAYAIVRWVIDIL